MFRGVVVDLTCGVSLTGCIEPLLSECNSRKTDKVESCLAELEGKLFALGPSQFNEKTLSSAYQACIRKVLREVRSTGVTAPQSAKFAVARFDALLSVHLQALIDLDATGEAQSISAVITAYLKAHPLPAHLILTREDRERLDKIYQSGLECHERLADSLLTKCAARST